MVNTQLSVLYDGGCGLCRREIAYYRRLDTTGNIRWSDITEDRGELERFGIAYADAMARLHTITADGQVLTGAYAFASIWALLPYWNWLSRAFKSLRLLPTLDALYGVFAERRLRYRGAPETCEVDARADGRHV